MKSVLLVVLLGWVVAIEPASPLGCACLAQFRCEDQCMAPLDPRQSREQKCPCAPACPPCAPPVKDMRGLHEQAASVAQQDGQYQETLARQSELQAKLFILAQKYAKDTLTEENNARKLSVELQESTSRAQIARNKMQRAVFQAQQLAQKTAQQYQQMFAQAAGNMNMNVGGPVKKAVSVPDSMQEAQTQAEVEISKDLQQNSLSELQSLY